MTPGQIPLQPPLQSLVVLVPCLRRHPAPRLRPLRADRLPAVGLWLLQRRPDDGARLSPHGEGGGGAERYAGAVLVGGGGGGEGGVQRGRGGRSGRRKPKERRGGGGALPGQSGPAGERLGGQERGAGASGEGRGKEGERERCESTRLGQEVDGGGARVAAARWWAGLICGRLKRATQRTTPKVGLCLVDKKAELAMDMHVATSGSDDHDISYCVQCSDCTPARDP